jgi:hypothetical protein
MPGGGVVEDLDVAALELTANTLIARAVFVDPHSGQATRSRSSLIDLVSFSKRASQDLQVYS